MEKNLKVHIQKMLGNSVLTSMFKKHRLTMTI